MKCVHARMWDVRSNWVRLVNSHKFTNPGEKLNHRLLNLQVHLICDDQIHLDLIITDFKVAKAEAAAAKDRLHADTAELRSLILVS